MVLFVHVIEERPHRGGLRGWVDPETCGLLVYAIGAIVDLFFQ